MLQKQSATYKIKQLNIFDISLLRISYDVAKRLWKLTKMRCWLERAISGDTHYDHLRGPVFFFVFRQRNISEEPRLVYYGRTIP